MCNNRSIFMVFQGCSGPWRGMDDGWIDRQPRPGAGVADNRRCIEHHQPCNAKRSASVAVSLVIAQWDLTDVFSLASQYHRSLHNGI